MSSMEDHCENGPTDARFGQVGVDGGDEEADSTLPPIRTPGAISPGQVHGMNKVYHYHLPSPPSHPSSLWFNAVSC